MQEIFSGHWHFSASAKRGLYKRNASAPQGQKTIRERRKIVESDPESDGFSFGF